MFVQFKRFISRFIQILNVGFLNVSEGQNVAYDLKIHRFES